jgi:DNA-binding XRE family transcriptional regulator
MARRARKTATTVLDYIAKRRQEDLALNAQVNEELAAMKLAQRLSRLREQGGLTQSQVAHHMGVSQPVVARIEAGTHVNMKLATLYRFASAVGGKVNLNITKAKPAKAHSRATR